MTKSKQSSSQEQIVKLHQQQPETSEIIHRLLASPSNKRLEHLALRKLGESGTLEASASSLGRVSMMRKLR